MYVLEILKDDPVGYRSIKPMLPDFLDMTVNEIHVEMANREFAEIELLKTICRRQ
jgi:5-methyltetrahydropteroyltriglutamate--homocysteine methyltransferase